MMVWLVLAMLGEGATVQPLVLTNQHLTVVVDPKGTFTVLDKRARITWQSAPPLAPFRALRQEDNRLIFATDAQQVDKRSFPVQVTMWLEEDELVIEVDTDDRSRKVAPFAALPPLLPNRFDSELLLPFYGNGIAVPVGGKDFQGWQFRTYGALDMPWVGLTDGKVGYLVLWDGRSADDGFCVLSTHKTKDGDLMAPAAYHEPTMQTFAYPRRLRYIFVANGGYVALCKRYRAYAQRNGFLVTLEEKAKRKPNVRLLAGAPNVWGGNPQVAKEAKSAGIDRLLINGVWAKAAMEEVKSLGYLNSRYDNYEDLYTCCPQHDPPYNMGTIADCVLRSDGNRQVGWETWDKKHIAHKRCSLLQLDVARQYILDQLKRHPHNAWFLDVTTATGLIECYDPNHPHDRTKDREAKRKLAKFVSDLGLVLGGEHGRWWGVDIYDYWEGMMSHNPFFTWPAGHLRPPEKREEIGERYLTWGLGHQRRVPLWELVFHDCVVSYWYWGDSTDFLHRVAPDLTDKKDAFNILYGTPPMFWVNRLGFSWSDLEMRKRLLQSYRFVCKLHEQIAFAEMLSHEWLTPDRHVQRTLFATKPSVTEVIVNFGEQPFILKRNGQTFVLPQYGFYAHGPAITQYRTVAGNRTIGFVQTPDYLYCDAAGQRHDFGAVTTDGEVTLKREGNEQVRIWLGEKTQELALRADRLGMGVKLPSARLVWLSEEGVPQEIALLTLKNRGAVLLSAKKWRNALLVWGKAAQKPNFVVEKVSLNPIQTQQGKPVKVSVVVHNNGGVSGKGLLQLFLDEPSPERQIAAQNFALAVNQRRSVTLTLRTNALDGQRQLLVRITPVQPKDELVAADNEQVVPFTVLTDYNRWRYRFDLTVAADGVRRLDEPVGLEVDWGQFAGVPSNVTIDPNSVRVLERVDAKDQWRLVPCIYLPTEPRNRKGRLEFLLAGETAPNGVRHFRVVAEEQQESSSRFLPLPSNLRWDSATRTVTTPFYRLRFGDDGMVREWVSLLPGAPKQSFLRSLGVSSAQTGWVDEIGDLVALECVSKKPFSLTVKVIKRLQGDFLVTREFVFYPRHFVVTIEANKAGLREYSRAYYALPAQFEDDKGNRARVDGKGDAEGVLGKNPQPKWYAVYAETWAHSCLALSPFDNLTYWDAEGAWGGISFSTGRTSNIRLAYVLHSGQKDATFAAQDYERLTRPPRITVPLR